MTQQIDIQTLPKDNLDLVAEIMYRSYRYQRETFPHICPLRWRALFINQEEYENRYEKESYERI